MEALSEREAQLALRNEIENGNMDDFIDTDDFDWNNGEETEAFSLKTNLLHAAFEARAEID